MGSGRNTRTAFGKQDTKGTAATNLKILNATQNTLEDEIGTATSNALTGVPFARNTFVNSIGCGGNVAAEISTATFAEIIKYAIGSEDAAPEDINSDATFFKHTFTPDLTMDDWLTFLKDMKDETYYEIFKDCKINQMDFNVTGQAIITYTLALLGISSEQTDGDPSAIYTLADNTGDELYSWDLKVLWKYGTASEKDIYGDLNDYSFSHNNNLNGDKRGLGRSRKKLDAQGRTHTISFSADFSKDDYVDMKADAKQGNHVILRIEIGSTNGGQDPIIAIEYPKLLLNQAPTANISGPDDVTVSVQGTADWDTTAGYNVKVEIVDETATKY